jgi:hypothetical protein
VSTVCLWEPCCGGGLCLCGVLWVGCVDAARVLTLKFVGALLWRDTVHIVRSGWQGADTDSQRWRHRWRRGKGHLECVCWHAQSPV